MLKAPRILSYDFDCYGASLSNAYLPYPGTLEVLGNVFRGLFWSRTKGPSVSGGPTNNFEKFEKNPKIMIFRYFHVFFNISMVFQ